MDFPNLLRGMFSLVIYDRRDGSFAACRDHVGKTPMYVVSKMNPHVWKYWANWSPESLKVKVESLSSHMLIFHHNFRYIGYGADGSKWFASEMKGTYERLCLISCTWRVPPRDNLTTLSLNPASTRHWMRSLRIIPTWSHLHIKDRHIHSLVQARLDGGMYLLMGNSIEHSNNTLSSLNATQPHPIQLPNIRPKSLRTQST